MRRFYPDELKAQAVSRVFSGETSDAVAKSLDLDPALVRKWVERNKQAVTTIVTQDKPGLLTLIGEYLEANLAAMRSQATRMGESAWINAQTTPDLISAHDHLGRRLVSILDRLHPHRDSADDSNDS